MEVQQMAGHLIRRLHQYSTQVFAARLKEAGIELTPVQFAALDAIARNPGADQASIAALIAYDKATIGGVIDRLDAKGHIARAKSTTDKRARVVNLTDSGHQLLAQVTPIVRQLQNEILGQLDSAERTQFLLLAAKALPPE